MNDLQDYTNSVIASIGPSTPPRLRQILTGLITHLHDLTISLDLTTEEWLQACSFINSIGKITTESAGKRDEAILVSDVLGIETLVDALDANRATRGKGTGKETSTASSATGEKDISTSAILGPFYRAGAPEIPIGGSIIFKHYPDEERTLLHGRITDPQGTPLSGAEIDIWHTAPDGLYDLQDTAPDAPPFNLRGLQRTDEAGHYSFECLKPVPYPIPFDGPAGHLLQAMNRHPMRPAHIHLVVRKPGFVSLTTQIFCRGGAYLGDDSVFAVKDALVVDFKEVEDGNKGVKFEVEYDICLAPRV